ncbi:hypothetical protein ACRALDRAFT_211102 [Sodiomyces alcalophilus JCM 7366]|uniref:uncharacterized protein n=1 Tax=Sodiomyces alcalophilus JCM 7366 TaxID=591952 RepID=UPI0039B41AA8
MVGTELDREAELTAREHKGTMQFRLFIHPANGITRFGYKRGNPPSCHYPHLSVSPAGLELKSMVNPLTVAAVSPHSGCSLVLVGSRFMICILLDKYGATTMIYEHVMNSSPGLELIKENATPVIQESLESRYPRQPRPAPRTGFSLGFMICSFPHLDVLSKLGDSSTLS